jgi:hypothetical protein
MADHEEDDFTDSESEDDSGSIIDDSDTSSDDYNEGDVGAEEHAAVCASQEYEAVGGRWSCRADTIAEFEYSRARHQPGAGFQSEVEFLAALLDGVIEKYVTISLLTRTLWYSSG